MKSLLIGFGYKARSGKDTCAQAIVDRLGNSYDMHIYAFANEVKREVNEAAERAGSMFSLYMELSGNLPMWVSYDHYPDMDDPFCPLGKQRKLLQWWGTEYRRARDPFYWIKLMDARITKDQPQVALITDIRFLNEALYVASNGGTTVRLDRMGYREVNLDQHISETELAGYKFDYELQVSDGDVEELKQGAIRVFEMIAEDLTPPILDGASVEYHE